MKPTLFTIVIKNKRHDGLIGKGSIVVFFDDEVMHCITTHLLEEDFYHKHKNVFGVSIKGIIAAL